MVLQVSTARCLVLCRHAEILWQLDGYNRSHITINGQMPGPLVEANEGDTLVCQSISGSDASFIPFIDFLSLI
jgi:hypothetical protein